MLPGTQFLKPRNTIRAPGSSRIGAVSRRGVGGPVRAARRARERRRAASGFSKKM